MLHRHAGMVTRGTGAAGALVQAAAPEPALTSGVGTSFSSSSSTPSLMASATAAPS
jgi:hypothetical protein